jgi:3-oxosteroid 1-dehydrogenase
VPEQWDLEVDFVAIGSGIGGLTGAIVAHDVGLQVAILEKTDKVGGVTALSGGQVWVGNNHLAKELGIEDSEAQAREYLTFLGGGEYVEENLQAFISNAPITLEHLVERAGARLKVQESADYYYPSAPGSLPRGRTLEEELFAGPSLGEWQERTRTSPHFLPGITAGELAAGKGTDRELVERRAAEDWRAGGSALAAYLVKAALVDRRIACYTGCPARELVSQGGAVVGVRAEREGMDFRLRARKGVLIATSGYDHDARMASAFERAPEWHSTTFPGLTGDGLTMAAELGGAVTASSPDQVLLSIHVPGETNEGAPLYRIAMGAGMPHAILVNRGGRRFADESFYRSVAKAVQEYDAGLQSFKNFPCFLICDQDHRDQFPIAMGGLPPGQPLPEGLGAQAGTLRELAVMLDIDAGGLEETVVRFNEFARAGKDLDFHREERPFPGKLAPIERPPYYGVPLTVAGVGVNNAGLVTDGDARVLRNRGDAIPGLYAAGNAAAHLEARRGYQSGIANARGMTYGYLAARHASR